MLDVAVSCGYSTCFAVSACDGLCHLTKIMDRVTLRNRPDPPWHWGLVCHHPFTPGWLPHWSWEAHAILLNFIDFINRWSCLSLWWNCFLFKTIGWAQSSPFSVRPFHRVPLTRDEAVLHANVWLFKSLLMISFRLDNDIFWKTTVWKTSKDP